MPFVKTGNTVYVSGQISNGPDGFITGKLGADMDVAAGAEAAKTCAISLLAQVKAAREMAESPPFYYDSELDEYWGNGREPT